MVEEIAFFKLRSKRVRVLHGAVFLVVLSVVIFPTTSLVQGTSPERIVQASQMVLQLDSFLAGGWIVGFFFFWGNLGKELRQLRRLWYKSTAQPSTELADFFKNGSWEKDARNIGTGIFAMLMFGIGNFVISGFFAVASVLSNGGALLVVALATLVSGTWFMLETWYTVHSFSDALGIFFDKLAVFLSKQS